jgi:lysozyme family protein
MEYPAAFLRDLDRLLGHEGRYVNDINDPGGETNWGISKRSYPHLDIAALTRDAAAQIYWTDFWTKVEADKLPAGITYQLFDFAVNSSPNTAVRYFQRAIGVADDGDFGPHSRAAAARTSESDMVMALNAERLDFMTRLKNWQHHGKGWARRIAGNLKYGVADTD